MYCLIVCSNVYMFATCMIVFGTVEYTYTTTWLVQHYHLTLKVGCTKADIIALS